MGLSSESKQYLLILARETISRRLAEKPPLAIELESLPGELVQPGASFVTLTLDGMLRGCIGSIEPSQPLVLDVRDNALGAAFRDPRFPPLGEEELERVHIEVSVLTPPQPLPYTDAQDLMAKLRPHVDVVIIQRGWRRATFLPQVWEKIPDVRNFLAQLCLKAGLPPDAYRREALEVFTYQIEKFEEPAR